MAKSIEVKAGGPSSDTKIGRPKTSAAKFFINHSKSDRVLRAHVSKALNVYRVAMMEWLLLYVIALAGKEGLAMRVVAQELGISMPQASTIVNQLMGRHLIMQKTQRQDRRLRQVVASAKGRVLINSLQKEIDLVLQDLLKPIPQNYLVFYERVSEIVSEIDKPPQNSKKATTRSTKSANSRGNNQ